MTKIVTIDLVKAKDIHRNYLRRRRMSDFKKLDLDYQRADEVNDTAKKLQVAAKKQILRDLPNDLRISQASSIDDLAALSYYKLLGLDWFK